MKKNIHIYEIQYNKKDVAIGTKALQAHNLGSKYYEYPTIKNYVDTNLIIDQDYYSFLSPKFENKMKIQAICLKDLICEYNDIDVFIFNPFQYKSYLYKNILQEFTANHGETLFDNIKDTLKQNFDYAILNDRTPNTAWSYCNYWVMKGWVLRLFQATANIIIEDIIKTEDSIKILKPNYKKVNSIVPFIYERLLTLFLISKPSIKYKNLSSNITLNITTLNEALILKLIDSTADSLYIDLYFDDIYNEFITKNKMIDLNKIFDLDNIEKNHQITTSDKFKFEKMICDFLKENTVGIFFNNVHLTNIETYKSLNRWIDPLIKKYGNINSNIFYFLHYNLQLNGYAKVDSHDIVHDYLSKINLKFAEKYKETYYSNFQFTDLLCAEMFTNIKKAYDLNNEHDLSGFKDWLNVNKNRQFYNGSLHASQSRYKKANNRIDVYCFFDHTGGIGKDARLISRSLKAINGINVNIINLSNINFLDDEIGDFCFFISPAQEIAKFLFKDPNLISKYDNKFAFMQWELAKWPNELGEIPRLFDKVFVSSEFTKKAFSEFTDTEKITMPNLVIPTGLKRNKRKIKFLTMFDCWSYLERKNPYASIKVFQALGNDYPIELVIKASNLNENERIKLFEITASDNRITIITEFMSDAEVYSLIERSHALLSFQRSEGFGRVLLEALCLGTFVFSNDYSGVSEFSKSKNFVCCEYELVPVEEKYPYGHGQNWAETNFDDSLNKINIFCKNFFSGNLIFSYDEELFNKFTIFNCTNDLSNLMGLNK